MHKICGAFRVYTLSVWFECGVFVVCSTHVSGGLKWLWGSVFHKVYSEALSIVFKLMFPCSEPANEKEEGSEGRATPGVDQET